MTVLADTRMRGYVLESWCGGDSLYTLLDYMCAVLYGIKPTANFLIHIQHMYLRYVNEMISTMWSVEAIVTFS